MQQNEEPPHRTETERHWDQICLGLTAAGTAVMAAVFLISGIAEERTEPFKIITLVKYAGGASMTLLFALMVVRVHRTIFPGVRLEVDPQRRKEADAKGVADILGTMILGLTLWVTILAFIPPHKPPHKPLSDDGSKGNHREPTPLG